MGAGTKASDLADTMWNTSHHPERQSGESAMMNSSPEDLVTLGYNTSFDDDCVPVIFSQMEFVPWDNPQNIVSAETEILVRRIKDNLVVLFFLIGGPASILNMAVFYKQGLKDRVNLCLFALSLADGMYLLAIMLLYGEQLYEQFTTQRVFGPFQIFLINHHFPAAGGCIYVSPLLSAVLAIERCLCVFNPLTFQTLIRTRTMALLIIVIYAAMYACYIIITFRLRVGCVRDLLSGVVIITSVESEFYRAHKDFINTLDSFVLGLGLPGVVITVVLTATILTVVKLKRIVTWRSETASVLSAPEVALTKMLVGNSMLFLAFLTPFSVMRFSWLFMPEMTPGRRHHNFFQVNIWIGEITGMMNATFNFFVYYSMGSRYRQTFWALIGRRRDEQTRRKVGQSVNQPISH